MLSASDLTITHTLLFFNGNVVITFKPNGRLQLAGCCGRNIRRFYEPLDNASASPKIRVKAGGSFSIYMKNGQRLVMFQKKS